MKRFVLLAPLIVSLLMMIPQRKPAEAGPKLPIIEGKAVLATVNGKAIFRDDLLRMLSSIHEAPGDNAAARRADTTALLDRMINSLLVVQEARTIGLDELPEVERAVTTYERDRMRSMLFGDHVRNIRKPDAKEVESRYREAVKEVKVASVLVDKEEDAKRLEAEVGTGEKFEAAAKRMIDEGIAKGNAEGEYLKSRNLLPEVARALAGVKTGRVTPLFRIGDKFAMVKLIGVRFPKDPEARRKAEGEALEAKRTAALKDFTEGLKKKYVKVDETLLKTLDYDSPEPGFEALMRDPRPVAEVKGEDPVTVRELSEALRKRFFHGMEGAAQKKRINRQKDELLQQILFRRVTDREARRLKIDRRPAFRTDVEEYRRGILFGVFVQKVIEPGIRLDEADLEAYRNEHIGEYTSSEMMRIESVAFSRRVDAENAVEKLRKGSDFEWIRANAEGRVEPGKTTDLPPFGKGLLMTATLPEGVRQAVAGAASGEYRIFSSTGNAFHVLYIREVVPPAPQPFESVRDRIAKELFARKRAEALDEYVKKLRSASDVKIFATGKALKRIVTEQHR